MTPAEISELEKLEEQYHVERLANPTPTRTEWDAACDKWTGRVNVEDLLTYGVAKGWIE